MENVLKNISLFSGLCDDKCKELLKTARKKTFPKNSILCNEGDISDSLYVIISGKVKVTINDEEGKEVILSILGPGEYFGEMSLLDSEPRSASVITKEPTEVLIISKHDFTNVFSANTVTTNLMKGLIQRLREANKKIESLALLDVYGRIARLLNQLSRTINDKTVIEERLTHQEIANMIGSSREMVSIILKELTNGGYITVDKKRITINKKLPYAW